MGFSLDYLVERVVPQMLTEHYEMVTAYPELSDAITEATLDATPADTRQEALDFMERLREARL